MSGAGDHKGRPYGALRINGLRICSMEGEATLFILGWTFVQNGRRDYVGVSDMPGLRLVGIALVVVFGSGCATISRGNTETFVIETEPPGAEAFLSIGPQCTTPCRVVVKRRGDFVVTIEKEGYVTVKSTVASSLDRRVPSGPTVVVGGIAVDAGADANYSHKPNPLRVKLEPIGRPGNAAAGL